MQHVSLSGTWTGMLVYGDGYDIYEGEELYFRMELQQEENWLKGTSADIGGWGASPDPATLSGVVASSKIYFIKRYESLHGFSEIGDEQISIDRSQQGPPIYYWGVLNEIGDTVEGEWGFSKPLGSGSTLPDSSYRGSGTWIMKRKD